jgi:hypothetical protein
MKLAEKPQAQRRRIVPRHRAELQSHMVVQKPGWSRDDQQSNFQNRS